MIELIKNERDRKIADLLEWLNEFNKTYPTISKAKPRHFAYKEHYGKDPHEITIPCEYNDRFESLLKEIYEDVYKEYECLLKTIE